MEMRCPFLLGLEGMLRQDRACQLERVGPVQWKGLSSVLPQDTLMVIPSVAALLREARIGDSGLMRAVGCGRAKRTSDQESENLAF